MYKVIFVYDDYDNEPPILNMQDSIVTTQTDKRKIHEAFDLLNIHVYAIQEVPYHPSGYYCPWCHANHEPEDAAIFESHKRYVQK